MSKSTKSKIDPDKVRQKSREIKDFGMTIPVGEGTFLVAPTVEGIPDKYLKILREIEQEFTTPEKLGSAGNSINGPLKAFKSSSTLGEPFVGEGQNPETKALFESLLPVHGEDMEQLLKTGSGIPYYTAMIGDMLLNPSTVDVLTFKKMMETDDVIYHALDYNGSSIVNSIGEYTHKNKDIEKLVQYSFKTLKRGFGNMIRDMNMAVGIGFSVHSLKWGYDERMDANIIQDVYPLPQSTIVFRASPDGHLRDDGIGQYVYNAYLQNVASAASLGWWRGAYDDASNAPFPLSPSISLDPLASGGDLDFPFRIPWYSPVGLIWLRKDNVMVHTHYGTTAQMNPYGRSALRAIYGLWLQSMAIQQFKMVALNRRSFPLLLVYCNQRTPVANIDPTDGSLPLNQPLNAVDAAATFLSDVNAVSTIILPGMEGEMFKVEAIKVEGNMDIFEKLERDLNDRKKITLGVPPNMMASGDGASFALAYIQGQSNSRIVAAGRANILECLIKQFVKPLIEENFPEEEHDFDWGSFEDEQISVDERLKNATLYSTAIDKGIAFPSNLNDLNTMREGLGLSRLVEAEFEEIKKETLAEVKELQEINELQQTEGDRADKRDINDLTEKPYEHRSDIAS